MKIPEPSDICYYPIGYEKYIAMQKYNELKKQILAKLNYKDALGSIVAVKVITEDDFNLLKDYCASAYTSCGDLEVAKVDGEYQGEDWYFIVNVENRRGTDENGFKCRLETLSQKKKQFAEFLAEYESE